ncbi:hypothetical protein RYX36_002762 [Vicia faba]
MIFSLSITSTDLSLSHSLSNLPFSFSLNTKKKLNRKRKDTEAEGRGLRLSTAAADGVHGGATAKKLRIEKKNTKRLTFVFLSQFLNQFFQKTKGNCKIYKRVLKNLSHNNNIHTKLERLRGRFGFYGRTAASGEV